MMTEWMPRGQTVNRKYYKSVLTKIKEREKKKSLELWKNYSWILHQDNTPTHDVMKHFASDKCISVIEHPPYSPNLALCNFY